MNRRGFLKALAASVPVIAISEELADLLAPRKTIILPPAGGWVWTVNSLGGYMYSRQLASVLRQHVQPLTRFSHLSTAQPFDKTLTWDVYGQ